MTNKLIGQFFLPDILMWVSMIFYTACFIPQLWRNYKHKNGTGVSGFFLFAYLNTYIVTLYYIFCLDLHLAYKCFCPLMGIATILLIVQRLYYDDSTESSFYKKIFFVNILGALAIVPFMIKQPLFWGNIMGWIALVMTLLNQLPQVFRIVRAKSFIGFSFMFVLITAFAASLELYAVLMLGLPLQSVLSAVRGLVYFVIFSALFLLY